MILVLGFRHVTNLLLEANIKSLLGVFLSRVKGTTTVMIKDRRSGTRGKPDFITK